jgi:hypothetical protein
MDRLLAAVVLGACFLSSPAQLLAQAGTRPEAHWGTFTKNFPQALCLGTAERAMKEKGYEIFEKQGNIRIGGNKHVIVQVSCVPIDKKTTSVTVSAFSTDSRTAELARNAIREYIVKSVRID